ncbi:hypothetical protein DPMN_138755 [Dreissena polymorpha]|uniref:Uncharacterized protein n=1 Tax=Dreissena polymorpha TaxID=45954 RepID=A0A9D4JIV7_DREPO|nr:hypothetical protein DPMN_138755 [Dreissena polymorpha]
MGPSFFPVANPAWAPYGMPSWDPYSPDGALMGPIYTVSWVCVFQSLFTGPTGLFMRLLYPNLSVSWVCVYFREYLPVLLASSRGYSSPTCPCDLSGEKD